MKKKGMMVMVMTLFTAMTALAGLWTEYGEILETYVHEGKVDYQELKEKDFEKLGQIYHELATVDLKSFENEREEMVFWVNVYNVVTLYAATEAYPTQGVLKSSLFFFKKKHFVGGEKMSLEAIENQILRKKFSDPRIHFAINCASKSCPVLLSRTYTSADADRVLDENALRFINDPGQVRFDESHGVLFLSKIFDWYKDDFVKETGSVENYLRRYLSPERKKILESRTWRIEYFSYDWNLNDVGSDS